MNRFAAERGEDGRAGPLIPTASNVAWPGLLRLTGPRSVFNLGGTDAAYFSAISS